MSNQFVSQYQQYLSYLKSNGLSKRDMSFPTWKSTAQYEIYFKR